MRWEQWARAAFCHIPPTGHILSRQVQEHRWGGQGAEDAEMPGGELEQDVTFILLVSLSTMPVLKAVPGCMFLAAPLWTNWGAWIPSRHCASYQQQTYVPEECRLEANVPSLVFAFSSFLSSADLSLSGHPALISALLASSQGFAIYLKHFSGSQKGQIKKEKKCGFAMCLNSSIVANCY